MIDAQAIVDEYMAELADAMEVIGWQIWASMHRHNGDPRWEYVSNAWIVEGDRCR